MRIKLWKTLKKFCDASHGFSIRFDKKEPPFLGKNVFSKAVLTKQGGGDIILIKILKMYRKKSHVAAELFMLGEKNSLFAKPCVVCVEKSLH